MPSTRKQKSKEKLLGNIMSDIENLDAILANLYENSPINGPEIEQSEVGSASAKLQETNNTPGEDLMCLLK